MKRNVSLFFLIVFVFLILVVPILNEGAAVENHMAIVFVISTLLCFVFGAVSCFASLFYRLILYHDTQYKYEFIEGYLGVFRFLIWKEFHPKG